MKARQPVEPSMLRCVGCSYDLTAATIGGVCPECGRAIEDSLYSGKRYTGKPSGAAGAALLYGCCALLCAMFPVFGILMGGLAVALFAIAAHDANTGRAEPRSMLVAGVGLVLGIVACVINFFVTAVELFGW